MIQKLLFLNVCLIASLSSFCTEQMKCPPINYPGRVSEYTFNGKGLDGVIIRINNIGSERTQVGDNGNFRYKLSNCPGIRLRIEAIKEGYSVVNHVEMAGHVLESGLGPSQLQFPIIMCKDRELKNERLNYYSKLADLNFERELGTLKGQIKELEKLLAKSGKEKVQLSDSLNVLKGRLSQMVEHPEFQQQKGQQVAKLLTNLNVSTLDTNYLKAFDLYRQGKLSTDNLIMEILKYEEKVDYSHAILVRSVLDRLDIEVRKVQNEILKQLGDKWSGAFTMPKRGGHGTYIIINNLKSNVKGEVTYKGIVTDTEIIIQLIDESGATEILRQPITSDIDWSRFDSDLKTYWLLLIRNKQQSSN